MMNSMMTTHFLTTTSNTAENYTTTKQAKGSLMATQVQQQEQQQQRDQAKPRGRISRTLHRVIAFKPNSARLASNNPIPSICLLSQGHQKQHHHYPFCDDDLKRRSFLHAFVARVFASTTSIKASYLELQLAQFPYNSEAIQRADQSIVDELKLLSELKKRFLRKELDDVAPHVTVMLSEIQEQQALLKTYQITMKKLESQIETKGEEIASMKRSLSGIVSGNKELHKKVNASSVLRSSVFDSFKLATLNVDNFVQFSHYAVRSIRNFTRLMVREMENANWDFDEAIRILVPGLTISEADHKLLVFEAYVAKLMLEGFSLLDYGIAAGEHSERDPCRREALFGEFRDLAMCGDLSDFILRRPESDLGKFIKGRYMNVVHAKMECSFFGSLRIRKAVSSGGFSGLGSGFFDGFTEMARRVWALHRLGLCLGGASVFEVRKGCRFSDVYMDGVNDEEGSVLGPDFRVGFTVVPGFRLRGMVVQAQVYMSPVN